MRISQSANPLFGIVILLSFCTVSQAFSDKTHKAISEKAVTYSQADAYLKNELGFSQGLGTSLLLDQAFVPAGERIPYAQFEARITTELPSNPCSILDFLKAGANIEDVPNPRARHHFHSPIANPGVTPPNMNSGLDNKKDHPKWAAKLDFVTQKIYKLSFDLTGASAENRALGVEGAGWETEYQNYYAWPDTRTYFYRALTKSNLAGRNHYLALTFISLGQTAHLLEDMGVPAHARNDFVSGHMKKTETDWGNPFEGWAEKQITTNSNNIPSSWLTGWTPQPKAFSKLSNYWDTDSYSGTYIGLPSSTWGLAEQTNYQFISTSTFPGGTGTLYQFPNPSTSHFGSDLQESAPTGIKLYFNGSNYGVSHIARKSYTKFYANQNGFYSQAIDSTITPDDVNVYNDYVRVTVPRTIDYAAGLINYFFRGKLEIEPNCLDCNTVTFFIRNDSNNSGVAQTLKGGTFELYRDDRDGNRTKVNDFSIAGWTANSTLDYDQQVTGTFSKPGDSGVERYTVVYKGQISENPDEPDNNDSNAIAVGALIAGYPIIAWGRDNEGEVSNVPEGNDFVDVAAGKYHALAIRSSGSLAAWGWNNYGQCNAPQGNDFIAIAGGSRHSIALKSDGTIVGWGDNSVGQIDVPTGNGFVAIASGDYHNLAIDANGLVVGWGRNDFGECDAPEPDEGTVFVAVSAGKYHSLALQSDGNARAWGSNNNGQTRIYSLETGDMEQIAAADDYNFLLLTNDMLVTWGGGDWAETGIPDYHYRQPDEHDFVAIAAGGYHILALTDDGQILSWGYNDYDLPPYPVPEGVVFTKDIAAGWKFSVALKAR